MSLGKNLNIGGKKGEKKEGKKEESPKPETVSAPVVAKEDEEKLATINESVVTAARELTKRPVSQGEYALTDAVAGGSQQTMLIVFPVGDEEYAIAIDDVKEVVPSPPIAIIPQVPDYIMGVANVRGNVLAIIDLATNFSKGEEEIQAKLGKFVLVVKSEDYSVAINVENVPNTMMVSEEEVDSATNIINHTSLSMNHIKGIVKKDKRMIVWIDIHEVITLWDLDDNY